MVMMNVGVAAPPEEEVDFALDHFFVFAVTGTAAVRGYRSPATGMKVSLLRGSHSRKVILQKVIMSSIITSYPVLFDK